MLLKPKLDLNFEQFILKHGNQQIMMTKISKEGIRKQRWSGSYMHVRLGHNQHVFRIEQPIPLT